MNSQMKRHLVRSGRVSSAKASVSVELGCIPLPARGCVHALQTLYFRDFYGGFIT